jgi:DNA-binding transcriptional regulator YiaG
VSQDYFKDASSANMVVQKKSIDCRVWLENGFDVRQNPYGEGISIHSLEELHRVFGLALLESTAALSPAAFKPLRVEMDLSQKAIARLLAVMARELSFSGAPERWQQMAALFG